MTSIFDLKTNLNQLSSTNEGTSRMGYDQLAPTRDVVGKNFTNGPIHFKYQNSGQQWWIPNRTYVRTRYKLLKGDGTTQLVTADGIAPNMGINASCFQNGEARINDKPISTVSDFIGQIDALDTRLTKSKSWLESIGEATNWWQTSQLTRMNEISSDGKLSDNPFVPASESTATRIALGYVATSSIEITADSILINRVGASPANDLPTGLYNVGDFILMNSGGNALSEYKILAVTTDTTVLTSLSIQGTAVAQADAVEDFSRVIRTTAPQADSRQIGIFETTWQPPLSLFKIDHALPSGRYELILTPQTSSSFQQRAIESILGTASKNPTLVVATPLDYTVQIVDMFLMVATVDGPRADDITYLLDLEQTNCQADQIDNYSFAQKNFDVESTTFALTVAYQDTRVGNNTALSVSKFKSYDSAVIPTTSQELDLNRLNISYAGQVLPSPDADPDFIAGTDYTIQRYTDSQLYSGAYFDTGGAETIQQFHDRGSYYYFSWPKDGTNTSTRVIVKSGFKITTDLTNMRVLLFSHSKSVARVRVQDGRVVDVQTANV